MTLSHTFMKWIDDQIVAGLSVEDLQALVQSVFSDSKIDAAEVFEYLIERLRNDVLLSELIRVTFVQGMVDEDLPPLPADMDNRIRQRLFGTKNVPMMSAEAEEEHAADKSDTVEDVAWVLSADTQAETELGMRENVKPGDGQEAMDSIIAALNKQVRICTRHWERSTDPHTIYRMRRQVIQLSALKRLAAMDARALTELEECGRAAPLEQNTVKHLRHYRDHMSTMLDGIQRLLEPALHKRG